MRGEARTAGDSSQAKSYMPTTDGDATGFRTFSVGVDAPSRGGDLDLPSLISRLGEQPSDSPTVFNFYFPDYSPDGAVGSARLVSPEAQVMTAPTTIAMLNGLSSLAHYGLTSCMSGFGNGQHANQCVEGGGDAAEGVLAYKYSTSASSAFSLANLIAASAAAMPPPRRLWLGLAPDRA